MSAEHPTVPLGFVRGVNTLADETKLPRGERGEHLWAREVTNADVSKGGVVKRRKGSTLLVGLTEPHSLYSDGQRLIGVADGQLVEFTAPIFAAFTPLATVSRTRLMSYAEAAGSIFYSNGEEIGRIAGASVLPVWVAAPDSLPDAVISTGGNLPPSVYQIALTFTEDQTRLESGSTEPMMVEIGRSAGDVTAPTSNTAIPAGRITLTHLPQRAGHSVNVYVTAPGGDVFYRHATVPHGTSTLSITAAKTAGRELGHALMAETMPAGQIVEVFNGRLLVAQDNLLWFSLPGMYGLTKAAENYLPPFNARITMVAATSDGVYISADKTYFISDFDSQWPVLSTAHPAAAVEGTRTEVPAQWVRVADVTIPTGSTLPYWFSSAGAMVGLPGGRVLPLTEASVAVRAYGRGASQFRMEDGIAAVVTAFADAGAENRMGVGDRVSVEVR